jgi:methyl-accepting chemotaxis protein
MQFLHQLTIAKRLSLGFGLLVFMLITLGVVSLGQVGLITSRSNEVTSDLMPKQRQLAVVANEVNAIARAMRNMMIMGSPSEIQAQRADIENSQRLIQATLDALDKVLLYPEARQRFQSLLDARAAFVASQSKFFNTLQSGTREEARQVLLEESRALQLRYMDELAALTAVQDRRTDVGVSEIESAVAMVQRVTVGMMVGAALLALGLGVAIIRSVTQPLRHAVEVANAVAEGDLSVPIRVTGRSETTDLLRALDGMKQRLAQVVGTVRQGAEGVATASAQIAQGNADLSSRTEQQASALEQTSASMEQMGSAASQNADHARQASQFAANARDVALQGGDMVGRVVQTMHGINESSRQISDIIGVIDGIAFQTNILALNAAVEAARAGEQGRGFAVVAGEVRNLAQRSAEAAKEIKGLIHASVDRVDQGSQLVEQAGSTMEAIVSAVRRVTDIVDEISSASREQSVGVGQVSEAVMQMDQTTQQNAALVEESAAAAASLRQQAGQLVQAVSVFKLDRMAVA